MTTTIPLRPITKRQRQVWRFVAAYHHKHRIGCSVRDVMTEFAFASPNSALCHLVPLRARGWVQWIDGRPNSIIPTLASLEGDHD